MQTYKKLFTGYVTLAEKKISCRKQRSNTVFYHFSFLVLLRRFSYLSNKREIASFLFVTLLMNVDVRYV